MTVSTLKPTVGMVVTDWFSLSLYRMAAGVPTVSVRGYSTGQINRDREGRVRTHDPLVVVVAGRSGTRWAGDDVLVLPAASRPSMRMRISLLPKSLPARHALSGRERRSKGTGSGLSECGRGEGGTGAGERG